MASERVFIPDNVDELEPSLVAFPDIIQTHGDLATCTQNRSLLHAFLNFSEADRAVLIIIGVLLLVSSLCVTLGLIFWLRYRTHIATITLQIDEALRKRGLQIEPSALAFISPHVGPVPSAGDVVTPSALTPVARDRAAASVRK